MPIIVNVEETKRKILEEFHRCCQEEPLNAVSMRKIAKNLGMSHAKILYYFESKDALVIEYILQYANQFIIEEYMNDLEKKPQTIKDFLKVIIQGYYTSKDLDSYNQTYLQIYTLSIYDYRISDIIQKAKIKWENSITEYLKQWNIHCSDQQCKAIMVFLDGILIGKLVCHLSYEDAMKTLEEITWWTK